MGVCVSVLSGTTQVSQYRKGKTNLDFTEARDSEWQWHQLDHMQVCSTPHSRQRTTPAPHHSVFYRSDALPAAQPTNSVKALKTLHCSTYSDLHMAQLMPLPLTVSCYSKIQIGFTFVVPAYPGIPGQRAGKRLCVCVCVRREVCTHI